MAALSAPPPASAPADDAFHISLYQFVHDGMRKCGVPPVPLGEAYLSAAATTAGGIRKDLENAFFRSKTVLQYQKVSGCN